MPIASIQSGRDPILAWRIDILINKLYSLDDIWGTGDAPAPGRSHYFHSPRFNYTVSADCESALPDPPAVKINLFHAGDALRAR
jgi:hypothetical protein